LKPSHLGASELGVFRHPRALLHRVHFDFVHSTSQSQETLRRGDTRIDAADFSSCMHLDFVVQREKVLSSDRKGYPPTVHFYPLKASIFTIFELSDISSTRYSSPLPNVTFPRRAPDRKSVGHHEAWPFHLSCGGRPSKRRYCFTISG
jgi:hypothetical protein